MSTNDQRQADGRSTEAIVDDLKSVIARVIAGNVEVAGRVRDLARAVVAQPPSPSDLMDNRRAAVAKWLDFNVASLRVISEHALSMLNGIVTEAETSLLGSKSGARAGVPADGAAATGRTTSADAVEIALRGTRGERVSSAFLIENRYDRMLAVSLEMNALTADGHEPVAGTAIVIDPLATTLPPRGQAIVHLEVVLDAPFRAGVSYAGLLRVAGFETKPIRIVVEVRGEPSATASPASPKRRPRRKPAAADR